jgi:Ca2+/H+ antiporter, TMEM165/GDT1 family
MFLAFFTTMLVVIPAELPDKTFVATVVLAARYRPLFVWLGVSAAFVVQSAVAVTAGRLFALLPHKVVLLGTGVIFAVSAVLLLRSGLKSSRQMREQERDEEREVSAEIESEVPTTSNVRAALISFGVIFAAEWGDITQIATAGLAARLGYPIAVFLGAAIGLTLVSGLGVLVGRWLESHMPVSRVQLVSATLLAILALVTVVEGLRA